MKSTSKSNPTLKQVLADLEDKLKKIEGQHSDKSDNSNEQNSPETPRLTQTSKSKTTNPILIKSPAKYIEDTHTSPMSKRSLEKKIPIKEEKIQQEKKSSSEEKSSLSTTPQSTRLSVPGIPTPLSSRSSVPSPTTTPLSTPTATPRDANANFSGDSSTSAQPRSPRTKELRKKISKSFSKAAINIGKFGEKLSSQVSSISTSTLTTPKSSGRNSSEVHSSSHITEKSNPFPEITPSVKNQAARALVKLESNPDYKNAGDTHKNFMLNSELIKVLSDNTIEINAPKLQFFLQKEALERSQNYEINTEIDIQTEPYASVIMERLISIEKNQWGNDGGSHGHKYLDMNAAEKKEVNLCFVPMFTRDEGSGYVQLKIEGEDGNYKDVSSLAELANFLNQDDPESMGVRETGEIRIEAKKPDGSVEKNEDGSTKTILTHSLRSKYISVFTCQFIANAMELLVFGGHPSITSSIRFYDGTPITLRGFSKTAWCYSKTADGGVKVKMLIEKTPDPKINGKYSKLENGRDVKTEDGAIATIEAELYFSANRDLQIGNLKVHSSGWNLAKDI